MTKKKKQRVILASDDIGKMIVEGINEQLRLHSSSLFMVFSTITVNDNSAEMIMQFMHTNLSAVLPFEDWSDWCRLTAENPLAYRWYGEMEALARQMLDLWVKNKNMIEWGEVLDRLVAKQREKTDGTDEWEI